MDCSTFSCDLHVLATPPAFVLSQDQTLRLIFIVPSVGRRPLTGLWGSPALVAQDLVYPPAFGVISMKIETGLPGHL